MAVGQEGPVTEGTVTGVQSSFSHNKQPYNNTRDRAGVTTSTGPTRITTKWKSGLHKLDP